MHLSSKSTLTLSATDLANHLSCKHLTSLGLLAARGAVKKPIRNDPRINRLVELGKTHEQNYVDHLRNAGNTVVDWPADSDERTTLTRTIAAMQEGADVIVQARLEHGRWGGYADFLIKTSKPSKLGNWSYEVVDTKLTSKTKGGTVLQLCLYSDIVEQLQGARPVNMYVVSPSAEFTREEFRFDDYAAYYRFVKTQLIAAVDDNDTPISNPADASLSANRPVSPITAGSPPQVPSLFDTDIPNPTTETYPLPVQHCDVCNWWSICNARRRADDHLSFVANCSRLHVDTLVEEGIPTLKALANLKIEDDQLPFKPKRGVARTYIGLQRQAWLQHQQETTRLPQWEFREDPPAPVGVATVSPSDNHPEPAEGLHRLPEPDPGDVFFDIEGDRFVGDAGLEYLFGYVVPVTHDSIEESDPQYQFHALWAFEPESREIREQKMFEQFIDWIVARRTRYPHMHIYHYNHYEPTNIKRLMSRYATREEEVDELLRARVFVDLYTVVRQSIRAGVESYSIKQLEQYYDFIRTIDLREEASPSLRLLEHALETNRPDLIDAQTRDAVEGYNKDDCLSTAHLRDWLEKLRLQRLAEGVTINRPESQSGEASEKVSDEVQETREIVERLRSVLPEDREAWTAVHEAVHLLAHLLEWHRRESKVATWEYYRLAGMLEEDLYDERAAIAGLELTQRIDKKKRLDEYQYPKQEVKLKATDALKTVDNQNIGTIESIDTIARRVVIKKQVKLADVHPRAVFDKGFRPPPGPNKALLRFGRFVAHNLTAIPDITVSTLDPRTWMAASRLLYRYPPTELLAGSTTLPTPLDRALDMAPRLDGNYLAIQGPPGSGKTYTGARMICELVRQGKRVGITATSHKVVRNLLDEVIVESEKLGLDLQCVQKLKKCAKKEDQHPRILEVDKNEPVDSLLATGEASVAGGTAWLWARPEAANAVDVLIVDEAGQMSLANVLAVSQAGHSLVLLGDPAQLDQPQKAAHPDGSDVSALEYILNGADIMPSDQGLFIDETRRLHPSICALTSELFYAGGLRSMAGLERQQINGHATLTGSGLYFLPVQHVGNRNESEEEAARVKELVDSLLRSDRANSNGSVSPPSTTTWTDDRGTVAPITLDDILIVAPYNGHVTMLQSILPKGARVGTVDKFQGQQAPIVIYSLAASSAEDAPRGMDFLYDLNRLNVATSRAKCACVLVASPRLLEPECRTPKQMRLANALARYAEMATVLAEA